MRAYRLSPSNAPLQLVEERDPRPGPGEIVVDIKAATLNYRDTIVRDGIRPHFAMLKGIVSDLLGPKLAADPERVRYAAWSVVGQCLFYFFGQPVILRLHPEQGLGPADVDAIARHITDFSLAALKHYPKAPDASAGNGARGGGR